MFKILLSPHCYYDLVDNGVSYHVFLVDSAKEWFDDHIKHPYSFCRETVVEKINGQDCQLIIPYVEFTNKDDAVHYKIVWF